MSHISRVRLPIKFVKEDTLKATVALILGVLPNAQVQNHVVTDAGHMSVDLAIVGDGLQKGIGFNYKHGHGLDIVGVPWNQPRFDEVRDIFITTYQSIGLEKVLAKQKFAVARKVAGKALRLEARR